MTSAGFTVVTVATGKTITVNVGGQGLTTYVAGDTPTIQTADAVRFKAMGLVTY